MNLRITDCAQISVSAQRFECPHPISSKPYSVLSIHVDSPSHGLVVIDVPLDRDAARILTDLRDDAQAALSETCEALTREADERIARTSAANLNTRSEDDLAAEAADLAAEMANDNNGEGC